MRPAFHRLPSFAVVAFLVTVPAWLHASSSLVNVANGPDAGWSVSLDQDSKYGVVLFTTDLNGDEKFITDDAIIKKARVKLTLQKGKNRLIIAPDDAGEVNVKLTFSYGATGTLPVPYGVVTITQKKGDQPVIQQSDPKSSRFAVFAGNFNKMGMNFLNMVPR